MVRFLEEASSIEVEELVAEFEAEAEAPRTSIVGPILKCRGIETESELFLGISVVDRRSFRSLFEINI